MRLVVLLLLLCLPAYALIEIPETYLVVRPGQNLWFQHDGADSARITYLGVVAGNWKVDPDEGYSHVLLPGDLAEGEYILLLSSDGIDIGDAAFNVSFGKTEAHGTIESSLFDIIVDIPLAYKQVAPGAELISTTKLINLGSKGRVDVFMDYWITDSAEKTVMKRRETVAVETQANFVKTFVLPDSLSLGDYCLHSRITYADGKLAEAGNCFKVISGRSFSYQAILYLAIAIIGSLAVFLAIRRMPFEKIAVKMKVREIVRRKFRR